MSGRKLSMAKRKAKLSTREELEVQLYELVFAALLERDPTIIPAGARTAATLAAVVATQVALQTHAVQRSFLTIEEDMAEYGTEFVSQVVMSAARGVTGQVRKVLAAPDADMGMSLADDWAGRVAGPTLLERHFGIPRSTLHRWRKLNQAVVLNTRTSQKPVFPLKQFVDGKPAAGIAEVLEVFGDHKKAWQWLISPQDAFANCAPIDALLLGEVEAVLTGAQEVTKTT